VKLLREIEPWCEWLELFEKPGRLCINDESWMWLDYIEKNENQFRLLGAICADCRERFRQLEILIYANGAQATIKTDMGHHKAVGHTELHAALLAFHDALINSISDGQEYQAEVKIKWYCGMYKNAGDHFSEPTECEATFYTKSDVQEWQEESCSAVCPSCNQTVWQSDGHGELAVEKAADALLAGAACPKCKGHRTVAGEPIADTGRHRAVTCKPCNGTGEVRSDEG
jgi:hypothetical protein